MIKTIRSLHVLVGLFLSFSCLAQNNTGYKLYLRSGVITPERNVNTNSPAARKQAGKMFVLVQFDELPDDEGRKQLKSEGVELLDYVPDNAFTAVLTGPQDMNKLTALKVRAIIELTPDQKMQPELASGNIPTHAFSGAGGVDIRLSYARSFTLDEVKEALAGQKVEILSDRFLRYQILELRVPRASLKNLANLPFVQYIEPVPGEMKAFNDRSKTNSRANILSSTAPGGFGLTGAGVVIGVGDDSNPTRHIDVSRRVVNNAAIRGGAHGLHIMGTVGGAGIMNEKYMGYAPKSTMIAQYVSNLIVNTPVYADDYKMVLTNNSYGIDPSSCSDFGGYNLDSYSLDVQVGERPSLEHIFAAGNSGLSTACSSIPAGFGNILTGFQAGKNNIVVGNTEADGTVYLTSSRGPLKDGRIKPEIVAQGTEVWSSIPTDRYTDGTGTSMATPAVTGGLALLYERYRNTHNNQDPKSALMKALLCNGATDLGNPGPDYTYGFGWMNLNRSIKMMENNAYFGNTINRNETKTHSISVPANTAQLKVMLYWHDRASSSLSSKALINDLDLTVTSPSSTVFPKILSQSNPGANATSGIDRINNIEQVVIDNPAAGNYTFNVRGFTIPESNQEYFVTYDIVAGGVQLTYPFGSERLVKDDVINISWNTAGAASSGNFLVEYSLDGGSSWGPISFSVAASARVQSWTVPDAATTSARVRISQNGNVLGESQNFTILGAPAVSLTANQCEGYIGVGWGAIAGATDYEVMILQGSEMVPVGTTNANSYNIPGLSADSTYYVAVRARLNGQPGRRSVAVSRRPNTGNCDGNISDNDLKLDAIVAPAGSGRKETSSAHSATSAIRIRIKNLDNAVSNVPINVSYKINDGGAVTETITPAISALGTYEHVFSQTADLSAVGTYKVIVSAARADDPVSTNNVVEKTFKQVANPSMVLPFFDNMEAIPAQQVLTSQVGFEGGDRYDLQSSAASGRARTFVNSNIAFSGSKAITLDVKSFDVNGNTNYLIGTFNFGGYTNTTRDIRLNFQYKNHGQLESDANNVWIRGKDTDPWIQVYDLFGNQNKPVNGYKLASSIEVTNILKNNNQKLSSSFQIRWGQYGDLNTADLANGSGYTFDDINIFSVVDDVQMLSILSPVTNNCSLGNAEQVKVRLRNSTSHAVTNIPIKYQMDQGPVVTEYISLAGMTSMDFTFPQAANLSQLGQHKLRVWVDMDSDGSPDNDFKDLWFYNSPVISAFPYLEDFEQGDGSWHTDGFNSSWQYGTPASIKINKAASGSKAWKTRLAGNYNDAEFSYLYSPCFSLNGMENPTLSFAMAMDLEDCANDACDVAYVEYSTDGGTWNLLGIRDDGTNWYDETNYGKDNWSVADYHRWHVATIPIPVITGPIRFRFVMRSDPETTREGIAIDDIHIYDLYHEMLSPGESSEPVTQNSVTGNEWVNFMEDGKLIVSLKPNNQYLGNTTVRAYQNTGNVRTSNTQYYLDRNYTIKPETSSFANDVTVRLYVPDFDAENLIAANGCSNCGKPESAYDLAITKFQSTSGLNEDGDLSNNPAGEWTFITAGALRKVPYDNGYYMEFQTKTFSEFWLAKGQIGTTGPLPVALASFAAKKKSDVDGGVSVQLDWKTASEKDFAYFQIERAMGEVNVRTNNFEAIGKVRGAGGISLTQNYSFLDDAQAEHGARYYRLKMVDLDGSFTYSVIRSVLLDDAMAWRVFPNPSSGRFQVEFKSQKASNVFINVYDLNGRLVRKAIVLATGDTQKQPIDLSATDLAPGIYTLDVQGKQDRQTFKLLRD